MVPCPSGLGLLNMTPEITYWNPYTSKYEVEKIYGEKWLRFSYEHVLGKFGLWGMVQRKWFSKWYGSKMDSPKSKEKVLPFIQKYGLRPEEFLEDPIRFKTFNEFFYRKLCPDARPVDYDNKSIVFPADGRHLILPDLARVTQIYAKGQAFDLRGLLGCSGLAERFQNGAMLISRLCPVDYHRFHFPISGQLSNSKLINGSLFSVSPIALRQKISIFWENKRYFSTIDSPDIGKVAQVLIGATCVGSVHITSKEDSFVNKGEEYGYFSFGGSCVITLYPENSINFRKDLLEQSAKGYESYFKFGESLGLIKS